MADKETKKHPAKHRTHKKVFDVVPPGKAPAAPNSRSVIPGDKPPVPDDQFVPGAPKLRIRAEDPSEERPLMDAKQHKSLSPVATGVSSDATDTSTSKVSENALAPSINDAPPMPSAESDATATLITTPEPARTISTTEQTPSAPSPDSAAERLAVTNTGHLATEQTVEADELTEPSSELKTEDTTNLDQNTGAPQKAAVAPTNQQQSGGFAHDMPIQAEQHSHKTIDELLSESSAPELYQERPASPGLIVSHHGTRSHWRTSLLIFFSVLILAAIALNFLLDAEVLKTNLTIPHTDWF